jgi:hypothetical protein
MALIDRVKRQDNLDLISSCEATCGRVWQYPKLLHYFTAHCDLHSGRIIDLLDEFLGDAAEKLHEDEIVVLICAAWLHDLAMQDFGLLEERGNRRDALSGLSSEESTSVRTEHAARIRELILRPNGEVRARSGRRVEPIQLPALGNFRAYIADVCYGHSTGGYAFAEKLDYRGNRGPLRRMHHDFRGQLLAALLLLADECDLDHGRVDSSLSDVGIAGMELVGVLHNLKHDYVYASGIRVSESDPSRRQLAITYRWPDNEEQYPGLRSDYRIWVEGKVLAQMNAVRTRITTDVGVFFDPDSPVVARVAENPPPPHSVDPRVAALLSSQVRLAGLGNLRDEAPAIADCIRNKPVTIIIADGEPVELGARQLIEAGVNLLRVDALDQGLQLDVFTASAGICDPFDLVAGAMGWEQDHTLEAEESRALLGAREYGRLLEHLLGKLDRRMLRIVIVPSLDGLHPEAVRLVVSCLVPLAVGSGSTVRLAVASGPRVEIAELEANNDIGMHRVPTITREDVFSALDRTTIMHRPFREKVIQLCRPDLGDVGFTQADLLRAAAVIGGSP